MKKQIVLIRRFTRRSFSEGRSFFPLPKLSVNGCSVGGLLVTILFATIIVSAQPPVAAPLDFSQQSTALTSSSNTNSPPALTFKIIDAPNNTFGYDVYADGRMMIHQTNIPAMPGNEGFKTRQDSEKVAMLVIEKIKKGEMPPTVSIEEMKKLDVIK